MFIRLVNDFFSSLSFLHIPEIVAGLLVSFVTREDSEGVVEDTFLTLLMEEDPGEEALVTLIVGEEDSRIVGGFGGSGSDCCRLKLSAINEPAAGDGLVEDWLLNRNSLLTLPSDPITVLQFKIIVMSLLHTTNNYTNDRI